MDMSNHNTQSGPLTKLDSLMRDREAATSPGVKASLTKQILAITGETTVPSASVWVAPEKRTKTALRAIVAQRKALPGDASPGVKAALTRHARELAVELGEPDPFPQAGPLPASTKALKGLRAQREAAHTAGVKAALTRAIKAMERELEAPGDDAGEHVEMLERIAGA